jgi:hypothetical protein
MVSTRVIWMSLSVLPFEICTGQMDDIMKKSYSTMKALDFDERKPWVTAVVTTSCFTSWTIGPSYPCLHFLLIRKQQFRWIYFTWTQLDEIFEKVFMRLSVCDGPLQMTADATDQCQTPNQNQSRIRKLETISVVRRQSKTMGSTSISSLNVMRKLWTGFALYIPEATWFRWRRQTMADFWRFIWLVWTRN